MRGRFGVDRRAVRPRVRAMRVHVVDEHAQRLRVAAIDVARARVLALELAAGLGRVAGLGAGAHRDHAAAVDELAVDDLARLALDAQARLEAEGRAQPVDRGGGVAVEEAGRDLRPAGWRRLVHGDSCGKWAMGSSMVDGIVVPIQPGAAIAASRALDRKAVGAG